MTYHQRGSDDAWERFAATGKIEAYLDYRQAAPPEPPPKKDAHEAEDKGSGPSGLQN